MARMTKKSRNEMTEREREYWRYIGEANEAKDRLAHIAEQLAEMGYSRKAHSAMTLVYRIEEWQNRG